MSRALIFGVENPVMEVHDDFRETLFFFMPARSVLDSKSDYQSTASSVVVLQVMKMTPRRLRWSSSVDFRLWFRGKVRVIFRGFDWRRN